MHLSARLGKLAMSQRVREILKRTFNRVGEILPRRILLKLNSIMNYMWVGHWMKSKGFRLTRRMKSKEEIFEAAAREIGDREVLYVEFGVYQGASMHLWSGLLRNPKSALNGFDSFQGLPEIWDLSAEKGHFALDGKIPAIADTRVTLFKGWFNETLPKYVPPTHKELFVNFDADLYSSTKTALECLKPHICPGTYLYFDEFQAREHELRAFEEFISETGWKFKVLAASEGFEHVLFQRT